MASALPRWPAWCCRLGSVRSCPADSSSERGARPARSSGRRPAWSPANSRTSFWLMASSANWPVRLFASSTGFRWKRQPTTVSSRGRCGSAMRIRPLPVVNAARPPSSGSAGQNEPPSLASTSGPSTAARRRSSRPRLCSWPSASAMRFLRRISFVCRADGRAVDGTTTVTWGVSPRSAAISRRAPSSVPMMSLSATGRVRLLVVHEEADLHGHAVLGDFVVFHYDLLLLDPGRLDVVDGLARAGDAVVDGVFEALLRIAHDLGHFHY